MLCKQLGLNFSNRTLAVTGMTGIVAVVNINGETRHKVCCLNGDASNVSQDDAWVNETCLVLIDDEISFLASIKKLKH